MTEETFLKLYAGALTEVEDLGETFEEDMHKIDKDFSKEYFCWMFENLLQYSLLEISWIDGKIDPREVLITNKVTKYGDILSLTNSITGSNFHWEDLIDADPAAVRKFLASVKKILEPMQQTFVAQFAAFDKNAVGDSLDTVIKGVTALFVLFMHADGKASDEETEAVKNCMMIDTFALIKMLIES